MDIGPADIKNELENSPPFQRGEIAKNYIDLDISDWAGEVIRVNRMADEKLVHVDLNCQGALVYFESLLAKYPEFKVIKQGQGVLIRKAKIKTIYDSLSMRLYDVELNFVKNEESDGRYNGREPLIKIGKGGKGFKMIDCEIDGGHRPALSTEAENTQLIRTKLSFNNGKTAKKWFSMDNPLVNISATIVALFMVALLVYIFLNKK
jgi:hypothetical protein